MQTIVIGSLNTDLIAKGIKQFPQPGELVRGKELLIGPGGKSRNIADMIAHLSPTGSVAMIGRTVNDPYGLWKAPIDALHQAGVNIDYVTVSEYTETQKLPGIAVIPVDQHGNNQIILLPGASDDFSINDIDNATKLFEQVGVNNGTLVLTLECPLPTAVHAVKLANKKGLKVMFDPGGIETDSDISELIKAGIYLIKPNEHETKILTGIDIIDFESAKQAAAKLHELGIGNVFITAGVDGAYLFTREAAEHIPVPRVTSTSDDRDTTGCGDQSMAALCAFTQQGKDLHEAADLAVLAGTLQFYKSGIKPVTLDEINV